MITLLAIGVALVLSLAVFLVLGDLPQKLLAFPRPVVEAVWRVRKPLAVVATVLVLLALWRNPSEGALAPAAIGTLAGLVALFLFAGIVFIPHVMLPSDGHDAPFSDIARALGCLSGDQEVAVLDTDAGPCAYPLSWLTRPHVAASPAVLAGGQPVAMTYCSLAHAAMAFEPSIDGCPLDLGVAAQLSNNLVFFDRHSGRLLQQLYGHFGLAATDGAPAMPRRAVRLMRFAAFGRLYPAGQVYFNPPGAPRRPLPARLWDRTVRHMMATILERHYDPADPRPYFPTIPLIDPRLPPKTQVYAFDINGDRVAFTRAFMAEKGGRIDTVIGGRQVAIRLFDEFDFVDAFTADGSLPATIDARGIDGDGQPVARQPMIPQVLWMVWAHYFPGTALDRL